MNKFTTDILNVLINVVFMYFSVRIFFSAFTEKSRKNKVIFSLLPSLLFGFTLLLVKIVPLKTSLLFISIVSISYLFEFTFKNRLLMSALFIGISAAAEALTAAGIMAAFSLDIKGAETGIYDIAGTVISKLIALSVIFMIRQAKHSVLFGKFKAKHLLIYALPIATVALVTFYYYVWHFLDDAFINALGLFSMLLLIAGNLYIFVLLDGIYDSVQNETKLKLANELVEHQKKQYDMLFEKDNEVRKIHHDYKNFLIGLLAGMKNGEFDEAVKIAEGELEKAEGNSQKSISGDSVIDAVINYKKHDAEKAGAQIEFSYRNLHDIKVSGVDMAILLGNALDNAIEEVMKIEGEKKINVSAILKGSIITIVVENPVKDSVDAGNLKTNKKDKAFHGFGIENMKRTAEKYKGEVITECKDGIFKLTAVLNNISYE